MRTNRESSALRTNKEFFARTNKESLALRTKKEFLQWEQIKNP